MPTFFFLKRMLFLCSFIVMCQTLEVKYFLKSPRYVLIRAYTFSIIVIFDFNTSKKPKFLRSMLWRVPFCFYGCKALVECKYLYALYCKHGLPCDCVQILRASMLNITCANRSLYYHPKVIQCSMLSRVTTRRCPFFINLLRVGKIQPLSVKFYYRRYLLSCQFTSALHIPL